MVQECLDSLKYGRPDEVIVVDDCSPVPFSWEGELDKFIQLSENGGYPVAVNAGWKEATGDVIITGNSDLVFMPGWLEHLLYPLQNGYDISSIRTTDCDSYDTRDEITDGDKFGSLWAMRRGAFQELGYMDEVFGRGTFEDLDYRRRAINAGYRIGKNHAGLVEHTGRATFDEVDPENLNFAKNVRTFAEKWGFLE